LLVNRLFRTLSLTAFLALFLAGTASAYDAGIEKVTLPDGTPGNVSRPFEIVLGQTTAEPQPATVKLAIDGFELDPGMVAGTQIGSIDYYTDAGSFLGNPINTNGDSGSGLTWNLDLLIYPAMTATVQRGRGLDLNGNEVDRGGSTLISFTFPVESYAGFKLQKIGLRFNVNWEDKPTAAVGAKNPAAGLYLIRSAVISRAPDPKTSVTASKIRVGDKVVPKTALSVKAKPARVKAGKKVGFTLKTTNKTRDRVAVWLLGRKIRTIQVGPAAKVFRWKAPRKLIGKRVSFSFSPDNGAVRKVRIKVTR
jgi:hypothetical protein